VISNKKDISIFKEEGNYEAIFFTKGCFVHNELKLEIVIVGVR